MLNETIRNDVATLVRGYFEWLQHCSNIATLCGAKNRRCESSRGTSPLRLAPFMVIYIFRYNNITLQQLSLTSMPYSIHSFHEISLVGICLQFDVYISIGTVADYPHLNSVRSKVAKALCQLGNKVLLSSEIIIADTSRFIHKNSEFHFTTCRWKHVIGYFVGAWAIFGSECSINFLKMSSRQLKQAFDQLTAVRALD